ncbi:interferon gamma-like isoform X2 [Hypanus sabinus]|uniref:interferon gamma-like isoform X2 n=1 Tax=Hypanus sabinus TaxID=79690 RepID=UPI0028C4C5C0|nr:interferon gamma-like isoform X2 [Hypanus sabinus]
MQSERKKKQTQQTMKNINHHEVADGGAKLFNIFQKHKSKATESGIMLNAIVRWYINFFENMKPHQNNNTKLAINTVANGLQEWLQSDKYFSLLNDLKELENIKWDDQLIQRKAILELEIFLSKMQEMGKRRRKRNMFRRPKP